MGGGEEDEGREAKKERKTGRYGHTGREAKRRWGGRDTADNVLSRCSK